MGSITFRSPLQPFLEGTLVANCGFRTQFRLVHCMVRTSSLAWMMLPPYVMTPGALLFGSTSLPKTIIFFFSAIGAKRPGGGLCLCEEGPTEITSEEGTRRRRESVQRASGAAREITPAGAGSARDTSWEPEAKASARDRL